MTPWFDQFRDDPALTTLTERVRGGGAIGALGATGSSSTLLAAALAQRTERPLLLLVAHLDEADEAVDELEALGVMTARVPAMEVLPGETGLALDLLSERMDVVRALIESAMPSVLVAAIPSVMQRVPAPDRLDQIQRIVRPGDRVDAHELATWLTGAGWKRVETIETAGEFAIRGDIIDLFPPGGEPARIDCFGDEVERVNAIDLDTMGSDRKLDSLTVVGASLEDVRAEHATVNLLELLPANATALLADVAELTEQGRAYTERVDDDAGLDGTRDVFRLVRAHAAAVIELERFGHGSAGGATVDLPFAPLPAFAEAIADGVRDLADLATRNRVVVFGQNEGETQRMAELLAEHAPEAPVAVVSGYLHRGFLVRDGEPNAQPEARGLALVPYHELVHRFHARRRTVRVARGRALDAFIDLQPGEHVVHREHGIAKYLGLRTLEAGENAEEFMVLEFARSAKLNVPCSKIDLVQKYIGAFSGSPELSTFGGKKWANQKERVADAVRDLAAEMLRLQAARDALPGIRYPADTKWQREFEAEFPYPETEDQLTAIAAVKSDMANARPMDRLICGDVGFGKTEVAIRAAFKAVESGRQVAVLVPTTVLAEQHERTFRARFADYPFTIASMSRFKTGKQSKEITEKLALGAVDIVIGTHRLLSKDVRFADLGLVIIDEEQRFGVEHKQKLLAFRATADVLTLSATPIPRTLHMSLLGLRDISSLTTPPLDRRAIVTDIIPWNEQRIGQAIRRELAREGQVFYLHNRVTDIETAADDVRRMAPGAKVIIGHGQMPARELEKVMLTFMRHKADILVSTTIIESGIDIPNANTIIVNEANRFGLSELHQLRGRVGRYKHRAYCYLVLPRNGTATEIAMKRLRALESFSMLGSGFKIALRDLELRGAGNLLGAEQSGHIAAVGYEMYCQLLEQAVLDLRNENKPRAVDATVDLKVHGSLPKGYIPSDARRMDAYRRISRSDDYAALEQIRNDLVSAYGKLPQRAELLFSVAEVRISAALLGIRSITRHDDDIIFLTRDPARLEKQLSAAKGSKRLVGDVDASGRTQVYYRPPRSYLEPTSLVNVLRRRLRVGADGGPASDDDVRGGRPPANTAPRPERAPRGGGRRTGATRR